MTPPDDSSPQEVFVFDTSFSQQRLWFIEQLSPGSIAYNMPLALRLNGPLDVGRLESVIAALVERHESLRTTFCLVDDRPVQVVASSIQPRVRHEDLAAWDEAEREHRAMALLADDASEPFDLVRGPLFRVMLVRLSASSHALGITAHHIIADAWSLRLLAREFATLYGGTGHVELERLPPLEIQYADYALWQRDWIGGPEVAQQVGYWRAALAGFEDRLDLARAPRTSTSPVGPGGHASVALPPRVSESLRRLAQDSGATVSMAMLACYGILLAATTGLDDIVIGMPVANRHRRESEPLFGFLANTLPVRLRVTRAMTFADVLASARDATLGALAHQDLPLERIIEELRPPRELGRHPLFQVLFVHESDSGEGAKVGAIELVPIELPRATARFDLTLVVSQSGAGIRIALDYRTDVCTRERAEGMVHRLQRIVEAMCASPTTRWGALCQLPQAEAAQHVEWARGPHRAATPPLLAILDSIVRTRRDAIAVSAGDQALTYGELDQASNRLARHLIRRGVSAEQVVGICLGRSLDAVIAVLAVLKAGAAWLPLDPEYPSGRLAFMVHQSRGVLVVTDTQHAGGLGDVGTPEVLLDRVSDEVGRESASPIVNPRHSRQLAYVIFTSGSTGTPKGAMIEDGALVNLALGQIDAFVIRPDSRVLQFAAFSFDAWVSEAFTTLFAGASLHLEPPEVLRSGAGLLACIRDRAVTHVTLPPSLLASLPFQPLPCLEVLVVAGEACSVDLARRWAHNRKFVNAYGPTESTVCATVAVWDDRASVLTIGRPIDNVSVHLVDGDWQLVPTDTKGQLFVGGAGVCRGYFGLPALTASRFLPDAYASSAGGRGYATGDLGAHILEGQVEFLGRLDDQLKVRGFRVDPGEVEASLLAEPWASEAIVVGRVATGLPESLVAYVVPRPGHSPDPGGARERLRSRLPSHLVPAMIIPIAALPRTPSGKIDRGSLARRPISGGSAAATPARTPLEARLARIWSRLLEVSDVGVEDDFFDLGGHSLLAVRLALAVEAELGLTMPVSLFFQSGTVASVAAFLERATPATSTLVDLSVGTDSSDVVLFHGLDGRLAAYAELARAARGRLTILGLEGDRSKLGGAPPPTLETLAAHLASALGPRHTPFVLVGWSFGGLLAFETARQLLAARLPIAGVVLLDTRFPARPESTTQRSAATLIAEEIARLTGAREPAQLAPIPGDAADLVALITASGAMPEARADDVTREVEVATTHINAMRSYVPQHLEAPVVLVRAASGATTEEDAASWSACAMAFEARSTVGDHFSMLDARHAPTTLDCLVDAIHAVRRLASGRSTQMEAADVG